MTRSLTTIVVFCLSRVVGWCTDTHVLLSFFKSVHAMWMCVCLWGWRITKNTCQRDTTGRPPAAFYDMLPSTPTPRREEGRTRTRKGRGHRQGYKLTNPEWVVFFFFFLLKNVWEKETSYIQKPFLQREMGTLNRRYASIYFWQEVKARLMSHWLPPWIIKRSRRSRRRRRRRDSSTRK